MSDQKEYRTCARCQGTGRVSDTDWRDPPNVDCPACNGTGRIEYEPPSDDDVIPAGD